MIWEKYFASDLIIVTAIVITTQTKKSNIFSINGVCKSLKNLELISNSCGKAASQCTLKSFQLIKVIKIDMNY